VNPTMSHGPNAKLRKTKLISVVNNMQVISQFVCHAPALSGRHLLK
jgi:hypothetical protein